jgi:5-bromo-4-chloroindolyl phosphate hydrolysis protein
MELTVLISIIGVALSVATFFIGRTTASKADGKQEGQILTELGYIKSGVDDMKRKMENMEKSYHNLEGRVARLEERVNIYHKE